MRSIARLRNPIQTYAWGSRTGIASFLGRPSPTAEPQAELWMGAHPQASSEVETEGSCWVPLADVIATDPQAILGPEVVARYGSTLPFLFKVLAAGQALSIQAHPNQQQANVGCQREDDLGIPRIAPERNYRDRNHKPEVIRAVTPFTILRGFRTPAQILELMSPLGVPELLPEVGETLRLDDLERFFGTYMALGPARLQTVLSRVMAKIQAGAVTGKAYAWVAKLEQQFPGDRGVLAPLFLHLKELAPGEAMFTGPGVLHAYLEGVGIELMANSDNVVRGGLTAKHVDTDELLRILRFESDPPRLLSSTLTGSERHLDAVASEFGLSVIDVRPNTVYHGRGGVEILLCSDGRGVARSGAKELAFGQGDSLFVPASAGRYQLVGDATLFRAGIPRRGE